MESPGIDGLEYLKGVEGTGVQLGHGVGGHRTQNLSASESGTS